MMSTRRVVIVVVAAALASACDSQIAGPSTLSVPATGTFSGVVYPDGHTSWRFLMTAHGTLTASLDRVDPSVLVGLSIGESPANDCSVIAEVETGPGDTPRSISAVVDPGEKCIEVFDLGGIPQSGASFTVSVRVW